MEQSSKNLSNVLLLLVLGSLIYYLMKPSKNVKSETSSEHQVLHQESHAKAKVKAVNKSKPKNRENFADNDDYENNESLKPVPDSALHNGMDNYQYFTNDKIKDSVDVSTNLKEMPVTKTNINPTVVGSMTAGDMNKVNNFNAFDDEYTPYTNLNGKIDSYGMSVDWSDLNNAFKGPLADSSAVDLVKMNKTEMKNYNSDDFLPKEVIDGAFDDYSQAKYNLDNDKLINTERYVIGINTVGQSLKNGSHDIRGTIPNPKFSVSPWNNSTYEPDYNIKPLC